MTHRFNPLVGIALLIAAAVLPACSSHSEDSAAPTAATAQNTDAYAFTIGEHQAYALRDGTVEFPNDNKVFGIGRTPEEVAEVLAGAGLPTDKLQLGLDPLLVKTPDHVLLFDTGAGGNFGDGAGHLATSLAAAGMEPGGVTDIFISHVHGDHVGGLVGADGTAAFPNAAIHISTPEWEFLQNQTSESASNLGISNYAALIAAMTPRVEPFAPGARLPGGVMAIEIKGHTPGHSGYTISSGEESLLYLGDTMHHYVVSVQRPDWAIAFDADQEAGIASRNALLAQSAADRLRVYAVHFPFPGLGKFEEGESGFVWRPE